MYKHVCMHVCMSTFHIDWVGFRREWCENAQVFFLLTEQRIHAEVAVASRLSTGEIQRLTTTYIHK